MTINTGDLKKKIIYRSTYRGTKEMDKLLSSFTKKYINTLNETAVLDYIFYRESDIIEILLIDGGINQELLGSSDHPPIGALFDIRKK